MITISSSSSQHHITLRIELPDRPAKNAVLNKTLVPRFKYDHDVHNYAMCTASVRRNAICKVSSRLYLGYQIIRKERRHIQVWETVCVIGV